MWLFFLFVGVPIIEIALFVKVGGAIGLWATLAVVVLTAFAGTSLMRSQGLRALGRLQDALGRGGDPSGPLVHGAVILVAGVLLLTPGFFTDALGLALLIPPLRSALIRLVGRRVMAHGVIFTAGLGPRRAGPHSAGGPGGGDTIDAEYEVLDGDRQSRRHDPRTGPLGPLGRQ